MSDTRRIFFDEMLKIAREDKDVIILTGDLGYSVCEDFRKELPVQFINAGIAEQNMVGVAAGLALAGKKPYCYSNALFITERACEFVRDDVCYPNLNVKLIGTGAAGFLGFTHNTSENEDMMILSCFPNIDLYQPQKEDDLRAVLRETYRRKGAAYIRL